jgi:acetylornithine/succinyldiaminopimelate/putrescine aminotransferase
VPSTTDDLRHAWRAVDRAWSDACFHISANARAVFERDHWLPLEKELAGVPGFVEVRGQGLMLGIELDRPCGVLLNRAAEAGLLLSVTADRVIRLVPSLILTADEAAQIVAILCPLVKRFLSEAPVKP